MLARWLAQGGRQASCRCLHASAELLAAPSGQMQSIKSLRELSGAPIADVKAALVEAGWDAEKAFQVLRKKGLAAAQKKAARTALEGLVCVATRESEAAVVEVNSETDFASRSPEFSQLLPRIAQAVLDDRGAESGSVPLGAEPLGAVRLDDGTSVQDAVQQLSGFLRENIRARRAERVSAPGGVIAHYVHMSPAPGLGRIAAVVGLSCDGKQLTADDAAHLQTLGHQLAMHIVAARPMFLDRSAVPQGHLEGERTILREQALKSGKPAKFVDKMVEGRMSKYFEDHCMLEQRFVVDDSIRVKEALAAAGQRLGGSVSITALARMQCGEGLEHPEQASFSEQVADTVQQAAQTG